MSRQVAVVYAEESTVARFSISGDAAVHDVRQRACDALAARGRLSYGISNGFPHSGPGSIILSSGSHGQLDFSNSSTNIDSVCKEDEIIIATAPSASVNHNVSSQDALSSTLTSPLLSHIGTMIAKVHEDFEQRLTAEQQLRQNEMRRFEVELNAEREVRKKEVEAEREARKKEVDGLSAQLAQHVKESKARIERKDYLHFEEKEKLTRDHSADIERERKRVDEKHEELLRLVQERDEYMQAISDDLTDTINATTDFITFGDETGFDRIKRRNLLDRTQQSLALKLGLSKSMFTAARDWRNALGPATNTIDRRAKAHQLLLEHPNLISDAERKLAGSAAAMTILSEVLPRVRLQGDRVAHGEQNTAWYTKAVQSSHSDDRVALTALLEYVSTTTK